MGLLAVGMQREASVLESLSHHLMASYQPAQWKIQGAGALFQCGSSVFPFGDQTFWHGWGLHPRPLHRDDLES